MPDQDEDCQRFPIGQLRDFSIRVFMHFGVPEAMRNRRHFYVADNGNNTIRKVTSTGVVTTLGGLAGTSGSTDGTGSAARFNQPVGVVVDSAGNLYVTDSLNNTIRVGTKTCPDQPTIDLASGPAGQKRQLDTLPQTASAWRWSVIRRPANSVATLSDPNVRNPTFTPDVADLYIFQLQATSAAGAICIRTLPLTTTPAPLSILVSSLSLNNGQCNFTFQSLPGSPVEVQASDDLATWTSVRVVTNLTGASSFASRRPPLERSGRQMP